MTDYGIRLTDTDSKKLLLTPDAGTVVSAGRVSMPAALEDDDTYGIDIDLPGDAAISEDDITVLIVPSRPSILPIYSRFLDGASLEYITFYANSTSTYYTRNQSTGVMTAWSAGARTNGTKSTWNPLLSVYPVAFWDKMGASTFTAVRLFAAAMHAVRETHTDVNFSLAGTASGDPNVGDPSASPAYIKDNNLNTVAGWLVSCSALDSAYQERSRNGSMEIEFVSAKTIYSVDQVVSIQTYGYEAEGWGKIYLYYGAAWHLISTLTFGNNVTIDKQTYTTNGFWKAVSKIKVDGYVRCRKGSGYSYARSLYIIAELRAWGNDYTDAAENKVVYTIGSGGVSYVDYVISVKKWDY